MGDFIPNPAFLATLGTSRGVGAVLLAKAEQVKGVAVDIAPVSDVGSPESPPGHYKESFHADLVVVNGALAGRVYNDDPIAVHVEFGTSKMEPRATLHRALEGGTTQ